MQSSHSFPPVMFILIPIFIAIVGMFTFTWISKIGGWSKLAKKFRSQYPFAGRTWNFRSARMRWSTNYNGCLTVGADQSGLFLTMFFLFRFAHPPLFIPWNEITNTGTQRILFLKFVQLKLGNEEQIPFTIQESLANELQMEAGMNWPQQSPRI